MKQVITAVSEAADQNLISLTALKSLFGITTPEQDAVLTTLIKQASAAIATACNRVFGQATVTETFFLDRDAEELVLSRYPSSAVSSITEDGVAVSPLNATTLLNDSKTGIIRRLDDGEMSCWPTGKIVVAYTGGYVLASAVPADLERACVAQINHLRAALTRDPMARAVDIPGVRRTEYWVGGVPGSGGSMAPEVEAVIELYRRPVV